MKLLTSINNYLSSLPISKNWAMIIAAGNLVVGALLTAKLL
jgi:hypothetical protein